MNSGRWLPRGYILIKDIAIGKLICFGDCWQLYSASFDHFVLIVRENLAKQWKELNLLTTDQFLVTSCDDDSFYSILSENGSLISSVTYGPYPGNSLQMNSFAFALKETRNIIQDISLGDGIFVEQYNRILPTFSGNKESDELVLGRYISGGVDISTNDFERLCRLSSWLGPHALSNIISNAGMSVPDDNSVSLIKQGIEKSQSSLPKPVSNSPTQLPTGKFELPGRPELESFFNEHVVDIVKNAEKYARMGIQFPGAIILHGLPGCGKTFAVERLAEYLGWPSYRIDSGTIGSKYIHETSTKIAEVFETAISNSPSMIIIDEMEAFLTDRGGANSSQIHHLEEVAEFLRRIPEAAKNKVLVIAMTNLIESIDPAILRRGRFDHIIEVKMPTKEEVASLLEKELQSLPVADNVKIDEIAELLKGHALSDVTYVIREAGRAAVKQDKEYIDMELFLSACESLPKEKKEKRKIGF